jgi:hypothetical protein
MDFDAPIESNDKLTEKELQSIAFMNQVIEDFVALRYDPVAWEEYCDDFEAIDGIRPK